MRVTTAKINKAVAHIAEATKGEYTVLPGGSNTGRPGTTWAAQARQTVFDSARGENHEALAFFLGVMDGYGILTEEWAAERDALPTTEKFITWFENGQAEVSTHKKFEAAKKERAKLRTAEQDKATIRDETLPIEERRAAFLRHNRRGNPFYEGQADSAPRAVESSAQNPTDETGYNGTNWPTHNVDLWISNDSSFNDTATNYAKIDETGGQLRDYLHRLLFNRDALASPERRRLTADDIHTLTLVAGDLTRENEATPASEAFGRIDWQYIRSSLLD